MAQRLISDFDVELVKASKKALMELSRALSSYQEAMILIGDGFLISCWKRGSLKVTDLDT